MRATLLDTDVLSEILKGKSAQVVAVGDRYLIEHGRFAFSAITFYEIYRGLHAKGAVGALGKFLRLADESVILPVSLAVLQGVSNVELLFDWSLLACGSPVVRRERANGSSHVAERRRPL